MTRALPFVIVGNPENRRVRMFQESLSRQGQPTGRVVRWLDLARGHEVFEDIPEEPALVRIDSFGEDFEVEREFLLRGYEDACQRDEVWTLPPEEVKALIPDRGRILAPRQHHLGFLRVLGDLDVSLSARPWLRPLQTARSIEQLFDKGACARALMGRGVPMARSLGEAATPVELRERMLEEGMRRVFVKLSCGSSASCLAIYEYTVDGDPWLFTSMEVDGDRLYNSLRPRHYREGKVIDRLLGFLLREGSHIEEHVPKARIGGRFFDARMLVIDGEVAFTVVRKSPHPITNLHLGGIRGTLEEMRAVVPAALIRDAGASCRRVFQAHDCQHIGVDVMFTSALDGHRVLEANAFGDLLPNLERDGLSVHEWEIRAARGLLPRRAAS